MQVIFTSGTLDKNGWFAPISLSVIKSEGSTFRTTKSSPVEKGSTETIYDESGKISTRIITTASNLKYFLQVRRIKANLPIRPNPDGRINRKMDGRIFNQMAE